MKKHWGITLLSIISGLAVSYGMEAHAEPVLQTGSIEFKQPDKTTFKGKRKGDERLSYVVVDGTNEIVQYDKDGYWHYTELDKQKKMKKNAGRYGVDRAPKSRLNVKALTKVDSHVPEIEVKELAKTTKADTVQKDRNLLVVMLEFSDTPLTYTKKDWYTSIFANQEGSLKDYMKDATKDQIAYQPVKNTQSANVDGVVKIKLDKKHPNSGHKTVEEGKFSEPKAMIKEAFEQVKDVVDLKALDKNKDKLLSPDELHLLVVFSGYSGSVAVEGQGVEPTMWPHRSGAGFSVDGLKLYTYTAVADKIKSTKASPEYQSSIGTAAHELGHDMDLPDLYNPTVAGVTENGAGLGSYSIMANSHTTMNGKPSGSYPLHYDAYSKVKLGLVKPTVITKGQTLTINEIKQNDFNVIKLETKDPKQYYLIENRQMKGYDKVLKPYVHSGGIGVYFVNESIPKNEGIGKQIVTLREADQGVIGFSKLDKGQTWGLDGFYYKGEGMHNKPQPTTLTKKTTPSTITSEGLFPEFDIIVNDAPKDKMSVTFKEADRGEYAGVPWIWKEDSQTLTFEGGEFRNIIYSDPGIKRGIEDSPLLKGKKIKTIIFTKPIKANKEFIGVFSGLYELVEIKGLELLDTSRVKDMNSLFEATYKLKSINVANWNTSNVENMNNMFKGVQKLTELDVSKWNTSKVKSMNGLFNGAGWLKKIDVSKWNTSSVESMKSMFEGASSLIDINVKDWNISKVRYMNSMFSGARKIKSLDLSSWEAANASKNKMFENMDSLDELKLSSGMKLLKGASLVNKKNQTYTGRWIGPKGVIYDSSDEFMEKYDGTNPGSYKRELK